MSAAYSLQTGTTITSERKAVTLDEWRAEAIHRFGSVDLWAFVCPNCDNVATVSEHQKFAGVVFGKVYAPEQCLGRTMRLAGVPTLEASATPCDWAAFGLLGTNGTGMIVQFPDGTHREAFAFAVLSDPKRDSRGS